LIPVRITGNSQQLLPSAAILRCVFELHCAGFAQKTLCVGDEFDYGNYVLVEDVYSSYASSGWGQQEWTNHIQKLVRPERFVKGFRTSTFPVAGGIHVLTSCRSAKDKIPESGRGLTADWSAAGKSHRCLIYQSGNNFYGVMEIQPKKLPTRSQLAASQVVAGILVSR